MIVQKSEFRDRVVAKQVDRDGSEIHGFGNSVSDAITECIRNIARPARFCTNQNQCCDDDRCYCIE